MPPEEKYMSQSRIQGWSRGTDVVSKLRSAYPKFVFQTHSVECEHPETAHEHLVLDCANVELVGAYRPQR